MSFRDIVGQDRATGFLKNAIRKDRLAHAYLFTGMDGVGKRTTAVNLAMAVNCLDMEDLDSCGKCMSCRKIQSAAHPDIQIIEPHGQSTSVDQVRELSRSLYYKPIEARKRVCIIVRGERIQEVAANALLKTLEEPPSDTLLIITALERKDLLSTVVSRCQHLGFSPLTPAQIADRLCQERGIHVHTARILSFLSEGSLGRAMTMDSQSVMEKREQLISEVCNIKLSQAKRFLVLSESLGKSSDDLIDTLGIFMSWFRDVMILKNAQGNCPPIIHVDRLDKLKEWSMRFSNQHLLEILTCINESKKAIKRNVNKSLVLESMLFSINSPGTIKRGYRQDA